MLRILTNQLKAALTHAGSGDIRGYLNGVHLDIASNGDLHIVATDSHRAFIGRVLAGDVAWTDTPQKGPFSLTIPRDVVKDAIRARVVDLTLNAMPDGRYELGGKIFAPCAGTFPDWRRIVPLELSGEPATFNWSYIADAETSLQVWQGKKYARCRLTSAGATGAAIVESYVENAFVVVMPTRARKEEPAIVDHFVPAR